MKWTQRLTNYTLRAERAVVKNALSITATLAIVLLSAVNAPRAIAAVTCQPEKAILFASLTDSLVNSADRTASNEKKAVSYAQRAVEMEKACMDAATSPEEHGRYYLLMAHDLVLGAVAEDELGKHDEAVVLGGYAFKIWKEIAAQSGYPDDIRNSARKQLAAAQ